MRLVGEVADMKRAYALYSYLSRHGIESSYELQSDPHTMKSLYAIWVYDEDRAQEAVELYEEFLKNPSVAEEVKGAGPPPPPPPASPIQEGLRADSMHLKVKVHVRKRRPLSHPVTSFLIFVCVVLYFWNAFEEGKIIKEKGALAAHILLTPLQQKLLFDYPRAMLPLDRLVQEFNLLNIKNLKDLPAGAQELIAQSEAIPSWKGVMGWLLDFPRGGWEVVGQTPLFEKISQGQVWRLITPTFLHRGFLHILFNMSWLWILGAQIEERLSRWKLVLLVLVVGVVANLAQYLMGGPFFLGFSGVVVGMAGFIWMRQKRAPWEGYPLNKPTIVFILLFVLAMFVLEISTVVLQLLGVVDLSAHIANTAHIVGGVTGIFLGRLSLFSRNRQGA